MNDTSVLSDIKLRLNIDYPTYEESYVYGYECALAELSEEDNPYTTNTSESDAWIEGWWDGFYGQSPLFTLEKSEEDSKAANDHAYHAIGTFMESHPDFIGTFLKISSALVATVVVGYQLFDLVA